MSSALSFTFENKSLTILGTVLNPLFVAKQVCLALGFKDTINAVKLTATPKTFVKSRFKPTAANS